MKDLTMKEVIEALDTLEKNEKYDWFILRDLKNLLIYKTHPLNCSLAIRVFTGLIKNTHITKVSNTVKVLDDLLKRVKPAICNDYFVIDKIICPLCSKLEEKNLVKQYVSSYEWGSISGTSKYSECCNDCYTTKIEPEHNTIRCGTYA